MTEPLTANQSRLLQEPPADSTDLDPQSAPPTALGTWEQLSLTIVYAVLAGFLAVFGLRAMYGFCRAFGTLEWSINYKRRRRFAAALTRIWGRRPTGSERRRQTLEFFRQSRCDRLLYLLVNRVPQERAAKLLTVANAEALDRATAAGCGAYVALGHYGAHHLMGMLMPLQGYRVAGVRDRQEGALRRFVQQKFNEKHPDLAPARVLFADSYPREIYRTLQEGYILGSAMDVSRIRDPNQKHAELTVFGERRYFLTGPLRIALRCRTPIFQGFIIPESGFRYRLELLELLTDMGATNDESTTIRHLLEKYAANLEAHLRAHPTLITRL